MADFSKKRGRCTNFGNSCPIADSGKIVETDVTDDFVCPDCGSDLTEIVKKKFPLWILGVIIPVVLGGIGVAAWFILPMFFDFGAPKTTEPQPQDPPAVVYATAITLSQPECNLVAGETVTLTAAVVPADAADSSVVWSSGDAAVATVANGTVTAVAAGETSLMATSGDGKASAQVAVKVTVVPETATPEPTKEEDTKPATAAAATFSGTLKNGYPHGMGTFTFKKSRRIDMHDEKGRTAAPGEYIVGEWDNGHLVQGRWFDASNNLKEAIVLGKAMNPEKDHALGRCSK